MATRARASSRTLPASSRSGWRLDLLAGLLFLAGLLTAVSLFSHDPADPSANLLGEAGATVSQELFSALGMAAHVLLGSWFVLVVLLLLRQGLFTWSRRLAGWLLLVPLSALLAERLLTAADGGRIGASLSRWLLDHFQPRIEA